LGTFLAALTIVFVGAFIGVRLAEKAFGKRASFLPVLHALLKSIAALSFVSDARFNAFLATVAAVFVGALLLRSLGAVHALVLVVEAFKTVLAVSISLALEKLWLRPRSLGDFDSGGFSNSSWLCCCGWCWRYWWLCWPRAVRTVKALGHIA